MSIALGISAAVAALILIGALFIGAQAAISPVPIRIPTRPTAHHSHPRPK